jgi:hypothetical protein
VVHADLATPAALAPAHGDAAARREEEERRAAAGASRAASLRRGLGVDVRVPREVVHQLLATDVALDKLGARGISAEEAEQLPRNAHVLLRNPHGGHELGKRLLLVGETGGGRALTLVSSARRIKPRG